MLAQNRAAGAQLQTGSSMLSAVLRSLRPRQWTKNLIIFPPIIFAARIHELQSLGRVCLTFLAFCLVSGAVYIVNDIADYNRDKLHPLKRYRPITAGQLSAGFAVLIAVLCAVAGLALSCAASISCLQVVFVYIVLMLLYTWILKQHAWLDIIVIAAGFVLRAVAGAFAASVLPSGWLLLCTWCGALFLGLEKRRQELDLLKDTAVNHRETLIKYSRKSLDRLQTTAALCTVLCYIFYCLFSYHGQAMLITAPLVVLGLLRYQTLTKNLKLSGRSMPEEIILTDWKMQITLLFWLLCSIVLVYR